MGTSKLGAKTLQLALAQLNLQHTLFDKTLATAHDPSLWKNGHRVFDALRGEVLKLQKKRRTPDEERLYDTLFLAELVAKVTYNAINPMDEFDDDSGWWIAPSLLAMASNSAHANFASQAWDLLCS